MSPYALRICCLLCGILSWGPSLSQEVAYQHFRVGREIPFNTVYGNIRQDSQGYLWLSTDQGVYRYNGQYFQHFPAEKDIADEEILYIDFDQNQNLWGINLSRQILYIPAGTDSLRLLQLPDSIPTEVIEINQLINNQLVLISPKYNNQFLQSYQIQTDSKDFAFKKIKKRNYPEIVSGVFYSKTGEIQIHYPSHLSFKVKHIKDQKAETILQHRLSKTLKVRPQLRSFPNHHKSILFFPVNKEPVYIFNDKPPYEVQKIDIGDFDLKHINYVYLDKQDRVWVCTKNGLIGLGPDGLPLFKKNLFRKQAINTIFQDANGAYWVGTEKNGLYYIPSFEVYFYNSNNSALPDHHIISLANSPTSCYAGTLSSYLLQIDTDQIQILYNFDEQRNSNFYPFDIDYADQQLYIALNDTEVRQFNLNTRQISSIAKRTKGLTKNLDISEDYILRGHHVGSELIPRNNLHANPKNLSQYRTTSIKMDRFAPLVWIGEISGLQCYDLSKDSLYAFPKQDQIPQHIIDIQQDQNGRIWIATPNNGVYGLGPDTILHHFTIKDGLLSDHCSKLLIDDENQLWVGTYQGINLVDLSSFEIQSIDRSDGLFIESVTSLSRLEDQLWVGTAGGLFRFPVQEQYISSKAPKISFTRIKILEQDTSLQDRYELSYYSNSLYVEFQGIDFSNTEKLQYRYRMLGIDTTWTTLSSVVNFVRYPQLSPGEYQFEVVAINGEGLSSETIRLQVEVFPIFWQTWWFQLGALASILAIVQLISYNYRQRRNREDRYKRRIEQLRSVALRSQMNPHFIFNTLNAILFFLVKNDRRSSIKYLSKFSKLIRSIFDHAKYDKITLAEEIQFLENYLELEHLRFSNRVSIERHIDPHLRSSSISIPPLLIQPLVENAFKHGLFHKKDPGHLRFTIQEHQKGIVFIVEDNGIGRQKAANINKKRKKAKKHSSSHVIQERIDLLNSKRPPNQPKATLETIDLMNENDQACGTRNTLVIYY